MTVIVSIDPGVNGAIAWLDDDASLLAIYDMPVVAKEVSPTLLSNTLVAKWRPKVAVVERQQSFPGQGVTSSFKTGVGYGIILGVLANMEVPVALRSSTVWKKALGLNRDKEKSRQAALARWPDMALFFQHKRDEGRAEAALLGVAYLMENRRVESPRRNIVKVR